MTMQHRVRQISLAVVVLVVFWLLPSSAQGAVCADLPNQAAAQRAHNTRDDDHDGIYCESLPCPCLKPGSSRTSAPTPRRLPATFRGRCLRGPRPDRRCTPGARFAGVTARQVCTPGYAGRVRNVSSTTKRRIYLAYGILRHAPFEYEIDHLISLELGGSNSPKNLWPQKEHAFGIYSAATKDRVENCCTARSAPGRSASLRPRAGSSTGIYTCMVRSRLLVAVVVVLLALAGPAQATTLAFSTAQHQIRLRLSRLFPEHRIVRFNPSCRRQSAVGVRCLFSYQAVPSLEPECGRGSVVYHPLTRSYVVRVQLVFCD
jgi:hypothetical protein